MDFTWQSVYKLEFHSLGSTMHAISRNILLLSSTRRHLYVYTSRLSHSRSMPAFVSLCYDFFSFIYFVSGDIVPFFALFCDFIMPFLYVPHRHIRQRDATQFQTHIFSHF